MNSNLVQKIVGLAFLVVGLVVVMSGYRTVRS